MIAKRYNSFLRMAGLAAVAGAPLLSPGRASAQTSVLSISATQVDPSDYQYSLTLGDTAGSATNIGTLWYAWIPGQDYLTTKPPLATITSPAGWKFSAITGGGAGDGYAIRWVANASGNQITPGTSLPGFSFITTDPHSTIFGNSTFFPTTPTSTFFTYSGNAAFSGTAVESVGTQAVPEPASLAILTPAVLMLGRRRRRAER